MKPSTAPLSHVRRAFARYDTRRNTPSGGGSRLRANPVHGCDSGNWAQTGTRWPGTRAVVHEQLSWFIRVRRSAIRVPVRCVAGSPAYCLNKSRALTDARGRERFQRGWRGRRGGEGCGAARDAAHGAARRCVSRRMCPHRLILGSTSSRSTRSGCDCCASITARDATFCAGGRPSAGASGTASVRQRVLPRFDVHTGGRRRLLMA